MFLPFLREKMGKTVHERLALCVKWNGIGVSITIRYCLFLQKGLEEHHISLCHAYAQKHPASVSPGFFFSPMRVSKDWRIGNPMLTRIQSFHPTRVGTSRTLGVCSTTPNPLGTCITP